MGCQDDIQRHLSVACSPPKLSKGIDKCKAVVTGCPESHDMGDERKGKTVCGYKEHGIIEKHGHAREVITMEGKQEFLKTNNQKGFYPASQMSLIVPTRRHPRNVYFKRTHDIVPSLSTPIKENSFSLSKSLTSTWIRMEKYFSNFILPTSSLKHSPPPIIFTSSLP